MLNDINYAWLSKRNTTTVIPEDKAKASPEKLYTGKYMNSGKFRILTDFQFKIDLMSKELAMVAN
jgi:hypothetical protein